VSQNGNGVVVWSERIPARMSWSELEERVRNVGKLKRALPFYVGDLVLACDEHGEKGSQLINEFGYSEGALANLRYVAKRFPPDERSSGLAWSFYQACAPFDKRTRERLITQGLSGEINRAGVRALAAAQANGASQTENAGNRLLGAKDAAFEGVGLAMAQVAKLYKGQNVTNETWADALDELIAKAMILRGMVA
jgi:hypothetical protein